MLQRYMMHVPLDVNVISPSSPWECKSYKQHKTNQTGTGNSGKHEPPWKFDLTMFRNNCGGFSDPRLVISEWNIRQQNHWVCYQYSILFTLVLQRQMIHVPLCVNIKIKQALETRVNTKFWFDDVQKLLWRFFRPLTMYPQPSTLDQKANSTPGKWCTAHRPHRPLL